MAYIALSLNTIDMQGVVTRICAILTAATGLGDPVHYGNGCGSHMLQKSHKVTVDFCLSHKVTVEFFQSHRVTEGFFRCSHEVTAECRRSQIVIPVSDVSIALMGVTTRWHSVAIHALCRFLIPNKLNLSDLISCFQIEMMD